MSADLKQRIREHLETAMSPDNLTSTREKYEQALALLREAADNNQLPPVGERCFVFDLSPASADPAVRQRLVELGWTPPPGDRL